MEGEVCCGLASSTSQSAPVTRSPRILHSSKGRVTRIVALSFIGSMRRCCGTMFSGHRRETLLYKSVRQRWWR